MEKTSSRINDGPLRRPFEFIQKITNYLSDDRKLGCGTFGDVYKGVLEDGEEIAVKILRVMEPEINDQQFQNEFENLKRLDHENIVRLLGFCDESEKTVAEHNGQLVLCYRIHRALCLEYMPNGSLAKLLSGEYHGTNWPTRYRIIKGICEGLKHLHEGLEIPILHLDLKPDNILLDQEMVPKIADFGLSRLIGEGNTKRTLSPLGTLGYWPPEFIYNGIISKEYDIFSLGVIITKIIVGLEGYSSVADTDAPEFIDQMYNDWRSLQEIPNYAFVESYCKQVRGCIEIAVNCMDKDRRKRPRIKDIVSKLDEIELFSSLQQHPGTTPDVSNIQWVHMQRQTKTDALQPQHDQQQWMVLMQHQFQQNQLQQSQHNIMPQFQSQPIQLQQLLWMLQQHSFQKKILSFANTLIQQNNIDPQVQYIQAQRGLQEVSSSGVNSNEKLPCVTEMDNCLFADIHACWPIHSLDDWSKQLENIGRLSLLRYLELGGTNVTMLPQEIMALEQLTTLNLRQTRVRRLPEFEDTNLVSLLADQLLILRGMVGMQKLEELSKVILGRDGSLADDVASLVNELGQLRVLGVRFSRLYCQNETDRRGVKHFLEEVGKSNLQSLFLDNYLHQLLDLLFASWAHKRPHNLRKFELRIHDCLPLVPQQIASLIALTHLHINVEAVEPQAVRALGNLPNLVLLKLQLVRSPSLTVSIKDGFQCLKVLWYNSQYGGGMGMQFEAGAMPQLRMLQLDLDAQETMPQYDDFDFGIEHLPYRVHVHATIDWKNTTLTPSEVEAAEAQIREQVSRKANSPVLKLNRRKHRYVAKAAEELVTTVNSLHEWAKQIDPRKLVVVHFSAGWCRASRKISPVFADLAKKFQNVIFLKVDLDVDEMMTVATQFNVKGVPTFLFMKGGYVKDRVVGAYKEELQEVLEEQADLVL